jgi:transposase
MTHGEILQLLAENERLRAENGALLQANTAWQGQVEQLRGELQTALERIAELEQGKRKPPSFVKPNRPKLAVPKGPRKKRATEHNTSRKRAQPTRIERHVLERCPDCNYPLRGESIDYRREVIELPPPQPVEVVEHQVIKRWCPCCGQWRRPQIDLAGQVIGQGRFGVRIASLVVFLRTTLRMPVRRVQAYLETLHGLQLSVGEVVELAHDVQQQLQGQVDALKTEIQSSTVVHGDETGWRENGQNGYVWAFVTDGPAAVRYFEYDRSRSHWVPQRILGADFRGWLVTDFYAAYNLLPVQHQRCWVHLLRDLHTLRETHPGQAEVLEWSAAVHTLYDEGCAWLDAHPTPMLSERQVEYTQLYQQMCALGEQYALKYEHPCHTLAKRLLRYQDELLQFVLVPDLPADNNLAERSIRPLVVIRKISGGSRSQKGTKTRLSLASLLHTWAARNLNPFTECLTALQRPTAAAPP